MHRMTGPTKVHNCSSQYNAKGSLWLVTFIWTLITTRVNIFLNVFAAYTYNVFVYGILYQLCHKFVHYYFSTVFLWFLWPKVFQISVIYVICQFVCIVAFQVLRSILTAMQYSISIYVYIYNVPCNSSIHAQ